MALLGYLTGTLVQRRSSMGALNRMFNNYIFENAGYNSGIQENNMTRVISLIENSYVDPVNMDTLSDKVIPQMLKELDPHSVYIPAKEAAASQEDLRGNFDGIGVMFNMLTDTVIIQDVIPGGPSSKVGIIAGDRIIKVNDTIVAGQKINSNDIVKRLKGKKGTKVKLGIKRENVDSLLDIMVTRGKVEIKSLDAAFMISPKIGYIKLLRFARTSHKEMSDAIAKLKKEGMEYLILDLQNNGGGYLDQAILIANEFLPADRMIVYTEGRGVRYSEQRSDGKGSCIGDDVIVLINEGSASASEIVAGALQDNDTGTIVGRRSFGKGLVQQQMEMPDGSLLNLTIARYHTPTGRSIQRPYDNGEEEYNNDIMNRYLHGEFVSKDSIKLNDSLRYVTPGGKVVYGGGGIMPDIFVPADTTKYSQFEMRALASLNRIRYSNQYVDRNRRVLEKISTKEELDRYFDKNMDSIIDGYKKFYNQQETEKGYEQDWGLIDKDLRSLFKASIGDATQLKTNAFYIYMSDYDEILKKGIETAKEHLETIER